MKSGCKLWIDDIRPMPENFDFWAKTKDEAVDILKTGNITYVSFDHDLGDDEKGTGYDVAMWVEREAYLGHLKPFSYTIHSGNPVGAKNIEVAMTNAERYWNVY